VFHRGYVLVSSLYFVLDAHARALLDASRPMIRPLRRGDLRLIFSPTTKRFGEEWLERQSEGEMYVAVAELSSVPV
jgi:hypothetical protein